MKTITTLLLLCLFHWSFGQSALTVICQQDPSDSYYNEIRLDGNLIEYGLCDYSPSFYVAIFDTDCEAWTTIYSAFGNEGHYVGNRNHDGSCATRQMRYFNYHQDDIVDLTNLDSLINFWIPSDHAFVIYTPLSYSGNQVSSLSPTLAQTFENLWGIEATQTQSMIVLFGVKGYPASYTMDTLTSGTTVEFSTEICPHTEQTATLLSIDDSRYSFRIFPNPSSTNISIELIGNDLSSIEVVDMSGRTVQNIEVQKNVELYFVKDLSPGSYHVRLRRGNEIIETTRISVSN
jgi:hypothetical protein